MVCLETGNGEPFNSAASKATGTTPRGGTDNVEDRRAGNPGSKAHDAVRIGASFSRAQLRHDGGAAGAQRQRP